MESPCRYPNLAKKLLGAMMAAGTAAAPSSQTTLGSSSGASYMIIRSLNATYSGNDYLIGGPDAGTLSASLMNIQNLCSAYGPFQIVQQAFVCSPCTGPPCCQSCCQWTTIGDTCCDFVQRYLSRLSGASSMPGMEACLLDQLRKQSIFTSGQPVTVMADTAVNVATENGPMIALAVVGAVALGVTGVTVYKLARRRARASSAGADEP